MGPRGKGSLAFTESVDHCILHPETSSRPHARVMPQRTYLSLARSLPLQAIIVIIVHKHSWFVELLHRV